VIDRVFVYGTLKRGGRYHHLVAPHVREAREGSVPGALVDAGGYPGWVAGEGRVHGEIFCLGRTAEALEKLDHLEGYRGPGDLRNLYERVLVAVKTEGGEVRAWAYRYLGSTVGRLRVSSGTW
jgi:gamma-glutamylcyclotransferase (GGCT)/AIG2-like uncharacterized protein YtfP